MNLAALVDRNLDEFGTYVSTYFEGRELTNREQALASFRLSNALRGLGVGAGDRVVVMLPNCPEVPQSYSAVLRAGGVVVPVLFLLATEELRLILRDSAAKVVITSPEFAPKAFEARAGLDPEPAVVVTGAVPGGALSFEDLRDAADEDAPLADRAPSDPAVFMYTSGTTGRPKGVVLTHANLAFQAEAGLEITEFDREDMSLGVLPMAHAAGLVGWILSLRLGTKGVLMRWFDPEGLLRNIEEFKVAGTALVPTMASFLLNLPSFGDHDLSSLKQVAFGASPCPVELINAFESRTGARVRVVYGLTEAAPIVTIERGDEERREGSVGRAIPGVEVAIWDPDTDRPLPPGEIGEIVCNGPGVMAGYHGMPEETAQALRGGWLHTGDLGRMDADGFVYVLDRVKDMIIRGGLNVYPRDIEEVLFAHPAVSEAAVVGIPDEMYGEEVVAFVVRAHGAGASEQDVLGWCTERLAKYKAPKKVTFVDALPKNQVGKVLKRDLRSGAIA